MNRRGKTFAGVGAIVLVATIAIACICIENWKGLTTLAFIFLLWSEIAFFGSSVFIEIISTKGQGIITRSIWYTIVSVYSGIVFILSIINIGNHCTDCKWFWVIQIILFTVGLASLFIGSSASKSVRKSNDRMNNKLAMFNDTLIKIRMIADRLQDNDQAYQLRNLAEELRFSDATVTVDADSKIEKAVSALDIELQKDEPKLGEISSLIIDLNSAINERKTQIKSIKRGTI